MAAKHRKRSHRARKVAMMGAATATATAMTVNMAAPANAVTLPVIGEVAVPIVDDVLDPGSGAPAPAVDFEDLIGEDGLLDLSALPADLSNLIPQGTPLDTTLGALLTLLGVSGIPSQFTGIPVRIITTGPPFTLLKLFGVDIGWTPAIPSQIADEINTTPYAPSIPLIGQLRLPVVIGFGLGAFAAGLAYPAVVADLPNQPGGANVDNPLGSAGSITILPMILLRNPGRPNGGLFARFDPIAQYFGYTTVTPATQPEQSSDTRPLHGTATLLPIMIDATVEYDPLSDFPSWPNPVALLNSGAALLFPTYILRGSDVTGVLPQIAPIVPDLLQNVTKATTGVGSFTPMNYYITVPQNALPLLEPARLPFDVINLFTGLSLSNSFADAIEPALKILVNLGYTDVDQANGYDRTLDEMGVPTPFFTLPDNVNWNQVPQDVIDALVKGFEDEFLNSTPFVADPGEALPVNALTGVLSLLNLLGVGGPAEDGALGDLAGLLDGLLDGIDGATADASSASARSGDANASTFVDETPTEDPQPDPEPQGEESEDDQALLTSDLDDEESDDQESDETTLSEDTEGDDGGPARLFRPRGTVLNGLRDLADNVLGVNRGDQDTQTVDDDSTDTTDTTDTTDNGGVTGNVGDSGNDSNTGAVA